MTDSTTPRGYDPILLLEAALALLLFGLALYFYAVPAGEGMLLPEWWTGIVLGVLFFGILLLDRWRRKRRGKTAFSETSSRRDSWQKPEG